MNFICRWVHCRIFGHHWHFLYAGPYYAAMEYADRCCRCGKIKSEIVMED